jgi:hypothetical protein
VWPLVIIALAATFYGVARLKRDYVDFEVYQTAGARVLSAEPLYRTEDLHYQFKYLPAFAIAMIPLAPIEPEVAKAIWFALSVGLLMLFVDRSVQALPDRRCAVMTLKWLTALLIGKFVVKELVNGQSNVLLGVLLVSALVATQQDRRRLAGVLVGLAVFVKPYAILLLPWLAVTQGIAALLAAGTVLAAGLVLPAALYGWSGNLHLLAEWYRTVTGTTPENLLFPENISFATMWAKWLGPGRAASAWAVATSVAALGLAAGVWFKRKHVREPNYLEISLLMLLVPLLSPQGWDYVLILATPAIVLLVDRWRDMPAAWRTVTMAALALTSFSIFDLVGRAMYWRLMNLSVISVGAIALAASLARLRWRGLA